MATKKVMTRIAQSWSAFIHPQSDPLEPTQTAPANADHGILVGDVNALRCRAMRRRSRRRPEIFALLQAALDTAPLDVAKACVPYEKAEHLFEQATQSANRLTFIVGALIGAGLGLGLGRALISARAGSFGKFLADESMIASLCFFALGGTLTSIFMRLSRLELRREDSVLFVGVSGLIQPFIALGFVAVVYVLIQSEMLGIKINATDPKAVVWVAAFLCGFSERFAPGILDAAAGKFTHDKHA